MTIDIYVERPLSGGLLLSCIEDNMYFKKRYFFYSEEEARELFTEYVKKQLASC